MSESVSKPLVLVIDPDADACTFIFALLESQNYLVTVETQGHRALEYIARAKPDLVVSELRLPDMDGFELLEGIKGVSRGTRVILISAHGDWDLLRTVVEHGADDLLSKPCREEEVLQAVRRVVNKATA